MFGLFVFTVRASVYYILFFLLLNILAWFFVNISEAIFDYSYFLYVDRHNLDTIAFSVFFYLWPMWIVSAYMLYRTFGWFSSLSKYDPGFFRLPSDEEE